MTQARTDPSDDIRFRHWAQGWGTIRHNAQTRRQVRDLLARLGAQGVHGGGFDALDLFCAADKVTNTAMWLVAHMSYARRVRLDGEALTQEDFKPETSVQRMHRDQRRKRLRSAVPLLGGPSGPSVAMWLKSWSMPPLQLTVGGPRPADG